MTWKQLLNGERRKPGKSGAASPVYDGERTEFERDHDRILFSTPFRRLIDKTQVFPLEKKYDTVRRRLTHSLEVGNLARSIGVNLAFNHAEIFEGVPCPQRNIPAVLASVGLAHDLGNPPFGHEGENAIRGWFETRKTNDSESESYIFKGLDAALN
jgi:dGTPase